MRQILVLAAIAAVALLGTTCSPNASDIYPMSVGSVWNMASYLLSGTTVATLDTLQTGTNVSTAMEKVKLTNGKDVIKFKNESTIHMRTPDTTIMSTTYSYTGEDGNAVLSYASLDDTTGDTVLMQNLSVGQTWNQGANAVATVIGQEDVTVTAGTYKSAWKVKMTTNAGGYIMDMFIWYAKGVGMVKMHYEFAAGGYQQEYNQELTSADIK